MKGTHLKHGSWVLVADGERALFLKNDGDGLYPNLKVIREMSQENPATREQGADRPGRYHDGPSAHRSAVEDTDWHRLAKERFADELAGRLYTCAHRGDFDQLVVVAPPLVLGEMRKKFHKEVQERIVEEIPKTVTNQPLHEIEAWLKAA